MRDTDSTGDGHVSEVGARARARVKVGARVKVRIGAIAGVMVMVMVMARTCHSRKVVYLTLCP